MDAVAISRRRFLRGALETILGTATLAIAGCGEEQTTHATQASTSELPYKVFTPTIAKDEGASATPPATPTANPQIQAVQKYMSTLDTAVQQYFTGMPNYPELGEQDFLLLKTISEGNSNTGRNGRYVAVVDRAATPPISIALPTSRQVDILENKLYGHVVVGIKDVLVLASRPSSGQISDSVVNDVMGRAGQYLPEITKFVGSSYPYSHLHLQIDPGETSNSSAVTNYSNVAMLLGRDRPISEYVLRHELVHTVSSAMPVWFAEGCADLIAFYFVGFNNASNGYSRFADPNVKIEKDLYQSTSIPASVTKVQGGNGYVILKQWYDLVGIDAVSTTLPQLFSGKVTSNQIVSAMQKTCPPDKLGSLNGALYSVGLANE